MVARYIPKDKRPKPFQPTRNQKCWVFEAPKQEPCIAVDVGPEQSMIKFKNGNIVCVPNSWLYPRDDA